METLLQVVALDDVVGRVKVFEALVKGKTIDTAGIPESFRVLVKEFQALGLDVQVLNNDDTLVDLKDMENDDEDPNALKIDELTKLDEEKEEEIPEPEVEDIEEEIEEVEEEFDDGDLDDLEFPEDPEDLKEDDLI